MNFETFKALVKKWIPYDTGKMYREGVDFFNTSHFYMARYRLDKVPYISYNEIGTRYTKKNQGFISEYTIGELNSRIAEESKGVYKPINTYKNLGAKYANNNLIQTGATTKVG